MLLHCCQAFSTIKNPKLLFFVFTFSSYIYKTHLRNVPKTHNFDDYFIFKCLLLGVNLLFEKIEIIEIPLAAVSKTQKNTKKTEKI